MAASDTAFKVITDGRTFTLDRITLGDWRMFKREFGLLPADISTTIINAEGQPVESLNIWNPEVLAGLMVVALSHERPNEPLSVLIAEVDALGLDGLEFPQDDAGDDEPDPTRDGADEEEAESPRKSGSSAKPRKKPGTQS